MARPSTKKAELNETDKLKQEIEELKNMIKMMTSKKEEFAPIVEEESNDEDEYMSIAPNKLIPIISLTNHLLVLSTERFGNGRVYEFNSFGQTRRIVYEDVIGIIHSQERFAKEGAFFIADKDVVKLHGLSEAYNSLLDKKRIDKILDLDSMQLKNVFNNSSKLQKETIVSIIRKKAKNGEDLDLNKVDIISKIYGEDILEFMNNENEEE